MPLGQPLAGHGTCDRVSEQEHPELDILALAERPREPQGVEGPLAPVRLIVDDDEHSHRNRIVAAARVTIFGVVPDTASG